LGASPGASQCPEAALRGVLSPLLWCLVVDELLVRLNEGSVYAQGYGDDICLLAVGKFPNTVSGLIQWDLHTVELWCAGLSLSVNPDKTGLVASTRKRKLTGFFEPRLFGKTLKCSMLVKYLGVILDSRLTWKEQMDVKVKKAQNLMWACRRACGATWGLKPRVVHWLYVAIIRPSVSFTSFVWWPGCQTASAKRKLSRVQRLACLGITGAMCTTPTNAVDALICLPPLDLVVQSEARSAVHRLWSLGCWSYLHPNRGHSSILMQLQQSDPMFNMGVDIMRPAHNFEPRYGVTMLTREDWTKATGAPSAVKGLVWFTDGSRAGEGIGAGVYRQLVGRRLRFSLGRYATVFQAEIYAILACVYEIQSQNRPEKYVSICSDSQVALKTLKAIRTTSPLVHQCQKALNDISIQHVVGLFWVPGHAGIRGNEIADGLVRGGTALRFLGLEPALGVSRQDLRMRLGCWLVNQHGTRWRGLGDTQRQAHEFISGLSLGTRAKFMTFNRTQSSWSYSKTAGLP